MAKTFQIVRPTEKLREVEVKTMEQYVAGNAVAEEVNAEDELSFGEVLMKIFSLDDINESDYTDVVDALEELIESEDPELMETFYTQLSAYKNMLGCEGIVMSTQVINTETEVLDDLRLYSNDLQSSISGLEEDKENEVGYLLLGGYTPTEECSYPVVSLAKFANLLLKISNEYKADVLESIAALEITIFHTDDVVKAVIQQ